MNRRPPPPISSIAIAMLVAGLAMLTRAHATDIIPIASNPASDRADVLHVGGGDRPLSPPNTTAEIPFKVLPVSLQKKDRHRVAKVAPEAARIQAEHEALLQQRRDLEIRDQVEARARFDSELRTRQADAALLAQVRDKIRAGNLLKDSAAQLVMLFACGALFVAAVLLYLLPSHLGRKKNRAGAIFVLNLVAGWTVAGWILALVWACTKDSPPEIARTRRRGFFPDDSIVGLSE